MDATDDGQPDQLQFNAQVIEQFRAGGEVQGLHRERLVLLTTTGRRSGEQITAPMMFHLDGGVPVVIASNMGALAHPGWFLNLEADPEVTVELPDKAYRSRAVVLDGAEYDRVWADVTRDSPFFLEHQAQTPRRIPLVSLPAL
ncbi:nitroreductase family deazaflavin-dependent oxidoreductase [Naasia lichenicola]|uniref:Nitroreductase family deazaflavin-dependent oxidoreductase n=2 Tax=Naasia lichenicola TaxID=2565933 RepID=A0A4S4FGH8_9MICO|nr:nitroreductase family deazaflavin-dependent oxidoreductase [Naasia lichenicola]